MHEKKGCASLPHQANHASDPCNAIGLPSEVMVYNFGVIKSLNSPHFSSPPGSNLTQHSSLLSHHASPICPRSAQLHQPRRSSRGAASTGQKRGERAHSTRQDAFTCPTSCGWMVTRLFFPSCRPSLTITGTPFSGRFAPRRACQLRSGKQPFVVLLC
jgi:hypothetical protein